MTNFYENIKPFVEKEISDYRNEISKSSPQLAFKHLENAHVLGQNSVRHHVRVHYLMLSWGISQKDTREIVGQVLRIVGTLIFSYIGGVPFGNTGGSNVPAFQKMPVSEEFQKTIDIAKGG